MVPLAGKFRLIKGSRPVRMSQIPSKSTPRLLGSLLPFTRPPRSIKTPAAMASKANMAPLAGKLRLIKGSRPVRMSQIPSKSIPRLSDNFID
jgi:hypothetical protein